MPALWKNLKVPNDSKEKMMKCMSCDRTEYNKVTVGDRGCFSIDLSFCNLLSLFSPADWCFWELVWPSRFDWSQSVDTRLSSDKQLLV